MEEFMLDKIEAYLNGEMTTQEEKAFDLEIEQNQELAEAVDNFGVANDAIELLIEDNLRKELNQFKSEETASNKVVSINKNKSQAKLRSLRTYLAAAASVAILLGFFGMNWADNNYSNSALSESFYEEGYNISSVRSGNQVINDLAEGLAAYEAQNFAQAISFFQGIQTNHPKYQEAQFYLANAFFENNDFSNASKQFQKVIDAGDVRYVENAEWYKILAQLAAGETVNQLLLNKIAADNDHIFNNKAISLQSKMGSFWRKLLF